MTDILLLFGRYGAAILLSIIVACACLGALLWLRVRRLRRTAARLRQHRPPIIVRIDRLPPTDSMHERRHWRNN